MADRTSARKRAPLCTGMTTLTPGGGLVRVASAMRLEAGACIELLGLSPLAAPHWSNADGIDALPREPGPSLIARSPGDQDPAPGWLAKASLAAAVVASPGDGMHASPVAGVAI